MATVRIFFGQIEGDDAAIGAALKAIANVFGEGAIIPGGETRIIGSASVPVQQLEPPVEAPKTLKRPIDKTKTKALKRGPYKVKKKVHRVPEPEIPEPEVPEPEPSPPDIADATELGATTWDQEEWEAMEYSIAVYLRDEGPKRIGAINGMFPDIAFDVVCDVLNKSPLFAKNSGGKCWELTPKGSERFKKP